MKPPLILLTGFLGAGKTTCLRALLDADRVAGRHPGVLVNDFGALGIDATLLGTPDRLVTLVDGCLCCSLQDDLLLGVLALLEAGADRVYIEPSGLADPVVLLESLLVPDVIARVSQIRVLGIRRTDQPPVQDPAVVELWTAQRLTADCIIPTHREDFAVAELPVLLDALLSSLPDGPRQLTGIGTGHQLSWQATTISLDPALRASDFDAWLIRLPAAVYRIKGFVRFVDLEGWWLVQGVGKDRRRYPWPGDPEPSVGLVLIGNLAFDKRMQAEYP